MELMVSYATGYLPSWPKDHRELLSMDMNRNMQGSYLEFHKELF